MRVIFDAADGRAPEEGVTNLRIAILAASTLALLLDGSTTIGLVRRLPIRLSYEERVAILAGAWLPVRIERGDYGIRTGAEALGGKALAAAVRRETGADCPLVRDRHRRLLRDVPALLVYSAPGTLPAEREAAILAGAVAGVLATASLPSLAKAARLASGKAVPCGQPYGS